MERTWEFKNGVTVRTEEFDYDLKTLVVEYGNRVLGKIYLDNLENQESTFAALDNGIDPISDRWEDGNGNTCTLDGWE